MEKVNWPMVGVQAVSTIVIIVITLLTFASQATQVLREEMRAKLTEIRTDSTSYVPSSPHCARFNLQSVLDS